MDISDLLRPEILNLDTYKPVVHFETLADELGRTSDAIIKLDANENPYGPPPGVAQALAALSTNRYPDSESQALRTALATFTGVPADHLMVGTGSDELLVMITTLFLSAGDTILNCPPTFGMYAFDAALTGARVAVVARNDDFSLNIPAIEAAVARERPKLLFVASPNNPDGSWLPDADLARLLDLPLVVVLDEAYVEFTDYESRIRQVPKRENLIVLRTFSKWGGLAGLRIGYGAFPTTLMPHLWKIKQPFNVNSAAIVAAMAVLQDLDYVQAQRARIVAERERLSQRLAEIPNLHPYPSHANFVLCRVTKHNAYEIKIALERQGILIRHLNKPGLENCLRIGVGRPEQSDTLITALRRILCEPQP